MEMEEEKKERESRSGKKGNSHGGQGTKGEEEKAGERRGGKKKGRDRKRSLKEEEQEVLETTKHRKNSKNERKKKQDKEGTEDDDRESKRNKGKDRRARKEEEQERGDKKGKKEMKEMAEKNSKDGKRKKKKKKVVSSSESEESSEEDEEEEESSVEEKVTALSPEELEKLKEEVDERKKTIATLRAKPLPMRKKLVTLRESQEFVEKYEGALGKGKGRKLYAYKVMMAKKWMKFQRDFENFKTACIPWEMKIKEIEIASYFIFLRWMYGINMILFGLTFGLVMVPEGYAQYSVLFYGYYNNQRAIGWLKFRMPLSYFLVGVGTVAYSYMVVIRTFAGLFLAHLLQLRRVCGMTPQPGCPGEIFANAYNDLATRLWLLPAGHLMASPKTPFCLFLICDSAY
ncbi:hypothetical protein JZ751_018905 [Albula glossodonta]|uniref:Uncharacterized protein n=1 Tax=Albula glossodonta TaxID=121402 RepID=A0A8T2N1C8_9TELE|nr:hypothetical protein JZ751_018905 [Albula glossodonta]